MKELFVVERDSTGDEVKHALSVPMKKVVNENPAATKAVTLTAADS